MPLPVIAANAASKLAIFGHQPTRPMRIYILRSETHSPGSVPVPRRSVDFATSVAQPCFGKLKAAQRLQFV